MTYHLAHDIVKTILIVVLIVLIAIPLIISFNHH